MTAPEVLAALAERGVRLTLHPDGSLTYEAPEGGMTPRLLAELKANICGVLSKLATDPIACPGRPPDWYFIGDPLTDLDPDSFRDRGLWSLLLSAAYAVDGHEPAGVFGLLRGLRAEGCRLLQKESGELEIVPSRTIDREALADYIQPHSETVHRLLADALKRQT